MSAPATPERRAFEQWARAQGLSTVGLHGDYASEVTRMCWRTWQYLRAREVAVL